MKMTFNTFDRLTYELLKIVALLFQPILMKIRVVFTLPFSILLFTYDHSQTKLITGNIQEKAPGKSIESA